MAYYLLDKSRRSETGCVRRPAVWSDPEAPTAQDWTWMMHQQPNTKTNKLGRKLRARYALFSSYTILFNGFFLVNDLFFYEKINFWKNF